MATSFRNIIPSFGPPTPPRSPYANQSASSGRLAYPAVPSSSSVRSTRFGSHSSSTSTSPYSPALRSRMAVQFIRPSRRDLVLIVITFFVSFILFHSPDANAHAKANQGWSVSGTASSVQSSLGRLADPANFWPGYGSASTDTTCSSEGREADFWEGNKNWGTAERETPGVGPTGPDELPLSDAERLLSTRKLGHAPGWTFMEQAYAYDGSLYIVTSTAMEAGNWLMRSEDRTRWPDLERMTSTGKEANGDPGNAEERYPTGEEVKFINAAQAAELWGDRVERLDGLTWMFNDGQFIDHYYHFAAELLMGAWRATASLDPSIGPRGETNIIPPRRAWFLHQDQNQWRDKPRFNPAILYTLFPSISLLYPTDWADFKNLTTVDSAKPRAFMFERILYADRSSAFYGEYTGPTSRTVASALYVGKTSRFWWEPIRRAILKHAGLTEEVLDRSLEGMGAVDPMHFAKGEYASPRHAQPIYYPPGQIKPIREQKGDYQDVVTYISRQGSRRHLTKESHEDLVRELEKKRDQLGFELNVVQAEKLTIEEQFALAGRTTIMLGVHGNGLTHLIWMPATPRSAVIEMYIRGGFARDYQWTAHCLGMRHYGINHDVVYTVPDLPEVDYPDGFHGTEITVDGKTVADIVEKQLTGATEFDKA